jgi:hypothetical protein
METMNDGVIRVNQENYICFIQPDHRLSRHFYSKIEIYTI